MVTKPFFQSELEDKYNPCMKCGSVQCAVCYIDFNLALSKSLNKLKKKSFTNAYKSENNHYVKWSDIESIFDKEEK